MAKRLFIIAWIAVVIATFILACLPVAMTSLLVYDWLGYGFAVVIFGWLTYATARSWRLSFLVQPAATRKIHAVPRRFGMGTLLVVSLAFGGLSMLLRWVQPPPVAVFLVLLYVMLIGLLQFLLHGAPRQASMIAGAFFVLVFGLGSEMYSNFSMTLGLSDMMFHAAGWVLGGAIAGYITGVLIGTVFMTMSGAEALFLLRSGRRADARPSRPETHLSPPL